MRATPMSFTAQRVDASEALGAWRTHIHKVRLGSWDRLSQARAHPLTLLYLNVRSILGLLAQQVGNLLLDEQLVVADIQQHVTASKEGLD
eukprot:4157968-Amphidinium_carterae.2